METTSNAQQDLPEEGKQAASIRWRFVIAALVLAALALPAVFYAQNQVRQASQDSSQLVQEHRDLGWVLNSLKDALQIAESTIYQYPLLLDKSTYRKVVARVAEVRFQSKNINDHYVVKRYSRFGDFAENLDFVLSRLAKETTHLLEVASNVDTRFPAAPIVRNKLLPDNQKFIQAIELAIAGLNESPRPADPQETLRVQEVMRVLEELRYTWSQQTSSARIFIADHSGAFGQSKSSLQQSKNNRATYTQRIDDLLAQLKEYDEVGKLGFQESQSLSMLLEAKKAYDRDFIKAEEIYASQNWRADLSILRDEIRPTLDQAWGIIELMQEELDDFAQQNVMKSLDTADTLSNVIGIFVGFMGLLLFLAYMVFEMRIRRPLLEVSKALDAAGRGENYLPVLHSPTEETRLLVAAFNRMQGQVTSRQIRLQSVLDNAAEGIITVDEYGIVETFNNAAQKLFDCDSRQAIGSPVVDLVRFPKDSVYTDFLELVKSPVLKGGIQETTVTVLRADDTSFPMAIKCNKMEVEGRLLYTAIVEDIGDRIAMMAHLREMAEHDSLTGLYNRQYFLTELERVVENIRRGSRRDFALLYIDLDNFKFVNDTLGHLAGDNVLVEVTHMLDQRNRKSDLLARIGGDEFAILLYDVKKEQVMQAAEAHRKLLDDYVFKYDGSVVQIGCSIGVTLFGHHPISKEDLLVQADVACHLAKRSGRNRVHIYRSIDQENMTIMTEDMGWAGKIKKAIEEDLFCLACQPIMELKSNQVFRQEVLLRMRDETGGLILPAGFIASAERFGLMRAVDNWVVNHALESLGKQLQKNPHLHFSINLSAESIGDFSMLETITTALLTNNVPPTAVTFEITETIAIANLGPAVEFLTRLRNLGCQTALDDFGVGYSSFAYLKDLPVDFVKIDGSFVRDVHRDNLQLAMVRSMNDIAHAMGKYTVAEFVDNHDAMRVLKEMGVDYIQGYYVGGPRLLGDAPLFQTESNVIRLV
ncbi:MAG TPA: EAL domain-containing protein [Gammaproteobacteria bacterium]|nr:EAL domain-containing protein [Gammaproteobacteria bacterium]